MCPEKCLLHPGVPIFYALSLEEGFLSLGITISNANAILGDSCFPGVGVGESNLHK